MGVDKVKQFMRLLRDKLRFVREFLGDDVGVPEALRQHLSLKKLLLSTYKKYHLCKLSIVIFCLIPSPQSGGGHCTSEPAFPPDEWQFQIPFSFSVTVFFHFLNFW